MAEEDEHPRFESLDDELRRISKTMALQPLEDPTGPSFYDVCSDISSLAKAGGVDDAQSTERAGLRGIGMIFARGLAAALCFALHPPKAATTQEVWGPGAPRSGTSRPGWFRQGGRVASALGLD